MHGMASIMCYLFSRGEKILFIDKQRWNVEAGEINGWTCILTFLLCMQLKKGDF